jgi:putative ABC transport system permease protein
MREFGVRLALGATPRGVLLTVMRDGFTLAALGLGIGLAAAVVVARAMRGMLFAIGPFDPVTFAAMTGVLLVSAGLAAFLPARRATRVDPMIVLRD